jgi:hypothetical protein
MVAAPHLLELTPTVTPCQLCPCHQQPLATATAAGSRSAARGAGLPPACQTSGQAVAPGDCLSQPGLLQLGERQLLRVAAGSRAATGGGGMFSRRLQPGEAAHLAIQMTVAAHEVPASMLLGTPLVLRPPAPAAGAVAGPLAGGAGAAAGRRAHHQVLATLCCELLAAQQLLLANSRHDLAGGGELAAVAHYVLQPAADGRALVASRLAAREQLLPPPPHLLQVGAP